jgi:hypothetical protein
MDNNVAKWATIRKNLENLLRNSNRSKFEEDLRRNELYYWNYEKIYRGLARINLVNILIDMIDHKNVLNVVGDMNDISVIGFFLNIQMTETYVESVWHDIKGKENITVLNITNEDTGDVIFKYREGPSLEAEMFVSAAFDAVHEWVNSSLGKMKHAIKEIKLHNNGALEIHLRLYLSAGRN